MTPSAADDRPPSDLLEGVSWDTSAGLTYSSYLKIPELLSLQQPKTEEHDELLFVIIHQASELWMKLCLHELDGARAQIKADDVEPAFKMMARVGRIQSQLIQSWEILATMTPFDYSRFRGRLGSSSGFQSHQYRLLEYMLGGKDATYSRLHESNPPAHAQLMAELNRPSLYDEFLRHLARRDYPVPEDLLNRDFSEPHRRREDLLPVFKAIYDAPKRDWEAYELCEELVDVEESFQLWRFRHMKTVQRIIGYKRGTGGSSGVGFLRAALDLTFFPELLDVRTEIGA